ncbi:MAG: helix-turn-helix transcriptional regulator [Clostridia bacterium]|nr:helix-turn-helix transcriptional regulator [Clostridia bacterium]
MREKKQINIEIGERIKKARERINMTQEKLAEKIDVSPQYISDLERGVVGVALPTLKNICITLGVTSDSLLFGEIEKADTSVIDDCCRRLSNEQIKCVKEIVIKLTETLLK